MDTLVLHAPKSHKVIGSLFNLSIIVGLIFSQAVSDNPPLFAKELQLAHSAVIVPMVEKERAIVREVTYEQRLKDFDNSVRRKYPKATISDVDVGIKHIKLYKYYEGKPVRINVVEIDKSLNPDLNFTPQLASNQLASKATIRNIAAKNNSIVAINGTFFKPQTGVPLGTLMINKQLYTGPIYDRVAMGFFNDGFNMGRVQLDSKIKFGKTEVKVDNINQPRMLSSYVLVYTPQWGAYSPVTPKYGKQMAVANGKVIGWSNGAMKIPENGYVVVGPQSKLGVLYKAQKVDLDIKTNPEWNGVEHIISGGPYLVKENEVFVDMSAQKLGAIGGRNPRSAIGYTKDNRLVIVAVDGREGSSVGMTLMELGRFMKDVGCYNAMNLDGGGSTVLYVKGQVVNHPQVKGGIALSNAFTVF